jgi:hypothetical protein
VQCDGWFVAVVVVRLCWFGCDDVFVVVWCLVHVEIIIHAFVVVVVLIAFRSVCLLVLASAGMASEGGPGRKPGIGLFSASLAFASRHFF